MIKKKILIALVRLILLLMVFFFLGTGPTENGGQLPVVDLIGIWNYELNISFLMDESRADIYRHRVVGLHSGDSLSLLL